MKARPLFAAALLIALATIPFTACKRTPPYRGPEVNKPLAMAYADHPAGSSLQTLIEDFQLNRADVRYRTDVPDNRRSAVYFMIEGNLHVDSQLAENGEWVLLSMPYLEPSDKPVDARLAKWDNAIETDTGDRPKYGK